MKKIIALTYIAFLLVSIQGCGDPPEALSVPEKQFKQLSAHTWRVELTKKDDVLQSGYNDLKLTFSGNVKNNPTFNYTITNAPATSPWPTQGVFSFDERTPETKLIRNPGTDGELSITYSTQEDRLRISFTYTGVGYPNARILDLHNVYGDWVFDFIPE